MTRWWGPPAQGEGEDRSVARLLHWVTLIVTVLTIAVGIGTAVVVAPELKHIGPNLLVVALSLVTQALLRAGKVRLAAHLFIFVLWATVAVMNYFNGGATSPLIVTLCPVVATTTALMRPRVGLVYGAMSVGAIGVIFVLEAQGLGFRGQNSFTPTLSYLVIAASVMMTALVMSLGALLREEADRRADQSETWFSELVRVAPEGILTVGPEGQVRTANPAALQLLGVPRDGLIGRALATVPGLAQAVDLADGATLPATLHATQGPAREVEIEGRHLQVAGEAVARLSLRDVTQRLAEERERAALVEQLHQAQKQDSIGLLAGGIAHDFNNLTTIALLNLEFSKPLQSSPDAASALGEVEAALHRAADLTRQLLAFSRKQVLLARNISVTEVVEGLRSMLRRLLPESIELRCELQATGIIRADAGQLEQVLVNLVVNARDAMPGGGVLTLSTRDRPAPAGGAEPSVVICVEDTGAGMSPEVIARIFEPFFTTKPRGQGTGLGLSVVDGIVRQSRGTLGVQSTEGKGTRFELQFPCVDAKSPDRILKPSPTPIASGTGRRVLLAEDEPMVRQAATHVLEQAGFEVVVASDGEDAIRVAGTAALDVVVIDVVMPKLGGPAAVQRLRETRPRLKALFVSGYSERPLEELGATGTHTAFLGKPFRPEELVGAVMALLSRDA